MHRELQVYIIIYIKKVYVYVYIYENSKKYILYISIIYAYHNI